MKIMDAVRLRIAQLCEERDLTITGLSSLCGITQSTVEGIMHARYNSTTLSTLQKICDGLEIDLPSFFCPELFEDVEPYVGKK